MRVVFVLLQLLYYDRPILAKVLTEGSNNQTTAPKQIGSVLGGLVLRLLRLARSKFRRERLGSIRPPLQSIQLRWTDSPQNPVFGSVMVGGAVARPTANSEPCVQLSRHTAPQYKVRCH